MKIKPIIIVFPYSDLLPRHHCVHCAVTAISPPRTIPSLISSPATNLVQHLNTAGAHPASLSCIRNKYAPRPLRAGFRKWHRQRHHSQERRRWFSSAFCMHCCPHHHPCVCRRGRGCWCLRSLTKYIVRFARIGRASAGRVEEGEVAHDYFRRYFCLSFPPPSP